MRTRPSHPASRLRLLALAFALACGDPAGPSPGPAAADRSEVQISRGILVAGTEADLILVTRDTEGRRVRRGGRTVTFVVSGGTSRGQMGAVTDQGDGTYLATFVGTEAGTPATVGATIDGQPVTQPLPTIQVLPGPVSPIYSVIAVTPRTILNGGAATFELTSLDAWGNRLPGGGHDVAFSVSGGSSTGTIGAVSDHRDGRYTASFTATGVGTPLTVGATVDGDPVTTPLPTVTVAFGVAPDSSTLTVSSDTVLVNRGLTVLLTVRDSAGIRRVSGGEAVQFMVLGSSTGGGKVDSTIDHDDGTYTTNFTATAAGGPVAIGATLNGMPVGGPQPTITILPLPIGGAQQSTVSVSASTVAAGDSASLTLVLRDIDGNQVPAGGDSVRFTLGPGGSSSGTIGPVVDNGDGSYRAGFVGTVAGTAVTVGAVINDSIQILMLDSLGGSNLPTVTVVPGPFSPDSSRLSAVPARIEVDSTAVIWLETRDDFGNRLDRGGHRVTFQRDSTNIAASVGSIGAVTDHGDGTYTAPYLGISGGTPDTIRASVDGTPLTPLLPPALQVVCTAGPASPDSSIIRVNDSTLPSGVSTTITLWARDHSACPVLAPLVIAFATSGGGSTGNLGSTVSRGGGVYTATFTGIRAGTATTILATIGPAQVTGTAAITVIPGDISVDSSVMSLSRSAVDSGARSVATLHGRDAAGNSLVQGGRSVTVGISGMPVHGFMGTTTDRNDGSYAAVYTGAVADPGFPDSITAWIEGTRVRSLSPLVQVVAGTISPVHSTLAVSPAGVAAGDSVLVTLTGRDAAGRALVTGDRPTVTGFTQSGNGNGVFTPVMNADDGSYTAYFQGRAAGPVTLGATLDGVAITTPPVALTVAPGPPSPGGSVVGIGADSLQVGDTTTVTLLVRDGFGNPVDDPNLVVALSAATGTVGTVGAVTYQGGRYIATFTAVGMGTAVISATIGGAPVTATASITVW